MWKIKITLFLKILNIWNTSPYLINQIVIIFTNYGIFFTMSIFIFIGVKMNKILRWYWMKACHKQKAKQKFIIYYLYYYTNDNNENKKIRNAMPRMKTNNTMKSITKCCFILSIAMSSTELICTGYKQCKWWIINYGCSKKRCYASTNYNDA